MSTTVETMDVVMLTVSLTKMWPRSVIKSRMMEPSRSSSSSSAGSTIP